MTNRGKREIRLQKIKENVARFSGMLVDNDIAKIVLAMLYWCEGGKNGRSLAFGNSDPIMIRLFLRLLRRCYRVDEHNLRGCANAGQIKTLKLWGNFGRRSPIYRANDLPVRRLIRAPSGSQPRIYLTKVFLG